MRTRLIISSLMLVLLMALTTITVASADGPIISGPTEYDGADVLADCGSFQVLDVYETYQLEKIYLDQQGNLVKVIVQYWGTDTFTNSVTGKSYPMDFHNTSLIDFTASPRTNALTGVVYRLLVPGAGAVFLDAGRIVFQRGVGIVFQAGPHQLFDGDFEALCAAMA
jgi:hypothetical protein